MIVIEESRAVVQELRTQNMSVRVRARNLRKLVLDCLTRWNSTYFMLHVLFYDFKTLCEEYGSTYRKLKLKVAGCVSLVETSNGILSEPNILTQSTVLYATYIPPKVLNTCMLILMINLDICSTKDCFR